MRKLNLGPTDILVVNFPNHTRAEAALVCRDIMEILKEAGIDIPLNRILPLPEGATLSKVCGPAPGTEIEPSVNALRIAVQDKEIDRLKAEVERWKFVARGGNCITPTPDFLDFIASRLVHVYGENPNIDFVYSLRERAQLIRSHLKDPSDARRTSVPADNRHRKGWI